MCVLGVQKCCASVLLRVIFSNLGLTNPPLLLIKRGQQRRGINTCCAHVDPAASLAAGWQTLGAMCTTIMVLSTLALVLRQHFFSRVKT